MKDLLDSLALAGEAKDRQAVLIIALTLITLAKAYNLRETGMDLSENNKQMICLSLLVHVDEEKQTCYELDFINEHYSNKL